MRISIVFVLLLGWRTAFVVAESDTVCSTAADDEGIISAYLQRQHPRSTRYRVHGWRWHTMSVLRELRLLMNVLQQQQQQQQLSSPKLLPELVHHTIGFNLKGLNRVESKLLFPWLTSKFDSIADVPSRQAFQRMLAGLESSQKLLIQQGQIVTKKVEHALTEDDSSIDDLASLVTSMVTTLEEIVRIQNQILVPAVTVLVPQPEQESFNNKVLMNMGILDSRLYLVGMHEAVQESTVEEQDLFQKEIPMIPRSLIPRWKRLLYDPRTQGYRTTTE